MCPPSDGRRATDERLAGERHPLLVVCTSIEACWHSLAVPERVAVRRLACRPAGSRCSGTPAESICSSIVRAGTSTVGSAYGAGGFFGRWVNYADGHGGNVAMRELGAPAEAALGQHGRLIRLGLENEAQVIFAVVEERKHPSHHCSPLRAR